MKVHVTQGNHEGNGVIISWVTPVKPGSNTVRYWYENGKSKNQAEATINTYRFFNYTSGYIHHCIIDDLEVRLLLTSFVLCYSFNDFNKDRISH